MEQVSDNKNHSFVYPTKNGETMILVSDDADNYYTKLVYYKGTFKNPIITTLINIDETDSYAKSLMLQEVLENEQDGFDGCELINHITGSRICSVRTKGNFDPYRKQTTKYKRKIYNTGNQNNQKQQQQGRSNATNPGTLKLQKIRTNSKWLYQPGADADLTDLRKNPIPFVGVGEDARLREAFEYETVEVDSRFDKKLKNDKLKTEN